MTAQPLDRETHGPLEPLELLERALGYTRVALGSVGSEGADRSLPTPCSGWALADLLGHMDDGLDAFLEAAGGVVRVPVPAPVDGADVHVLELKACHLLAVWGGRTPARVAVADRTLPTGLLVSAAALEITVHGWDVARATGLDHEIPDDLAQALLAVAREVVVADDRVERFAAPTPCAPGAGAPTRLLAFLGRT